MVVVYHTKWKLLSDFDAAWFMYQHHMKRLYRQPKMAQRHKHLFWYNCHDLGATALEDEWNGIVLYNDLHYNHLYPDHRDVYQCMSFNDTVMFDSCQMQSYVMTCIDKHFNSIKIGSKMLSNAHACWSTISLTPYDRMYVHDIYIRLFMKTISLNEGLRLFNPGKAMALYISKHNML